MVLTPIFAVCCAFYLIIYFHLKNLLFFSNAVAKPLLFYKRFFFFQSLSARTKLALFFCRSALFSSLGRTEGLFPRLKTPNRWRRRKNDASLLCHTDLLLCEFFQILTQYFQIPLILRQERFARVEIPILGPMKAHECSLFAFVRNLSEQLCQFLSRAKISS